MPSDTSLTGVHIDLTLDLMCCAVAQQILDTLLSETGDLSLEYVRYHASYDLLAENASDPYALKLPLHPDILSI